MRVYGVLKNPRFDGESVFILCNNLEYAAYVAGLSRVEYLRQLIDLNPQFKEFFTYCGHEKHIIERSNL